MAGFAMRANAGAVVLDFMTRQIATEPPIHIFVEQNSQIRQVAGPVV
jgi:hypothetical protein